MQERVNRMVKGIIVFGTIVMCLLAVYSLSEAGTSDVTLQWDPPDIIVGVVGYKVYWGQTTGAYPYSADAGQKTTYTVPALPDGVWNFVVTAYDNRGLESGYSNVVTTSLDTKPPANPKNLRSISIRMTVDVKSGSITSTMTTGK